MQFGADNTPKMKEKKWLSFTIRSTNTQIFIGEKIEIRYP